VLLDVQATQSAGHRDRGVARYVAELAAALVRGPDGDLVHSLLLNPDLPPPGRVQPLVATGRLVYSDRCDLDGAGLLHVMSPFELDVALPRLWLARGGARRLPLVVTLFDVIPERFPDRYLADPGLRRRYRARTALVRAADAVLAISEATAADAVEVLRLPEEKIAVVGAAAAAHFVPAPSRAAAHAAVRAALPGLRERFVCYPGGMDDRKNFERLFRAWALLPADVRARFQLVFVCAMDELGRNHLVHLARAAGIADEVLLPGFVSDDVLRLLYQAADLVVFPSLYEGFGLPVAEALACDAPVIGSDGSAVRELLRPEARFDPYDEHAIATAIASALTDEHQRGLLAEQVRAPRDDWAAVAGRTAAVYRRLLGAAARGPRRKPRIAFVTPLPPALSSVADYSYMLLEALRAHCEIHAFVDGERWMIPALGPPRAPQGVEVLPLSQLPAQDRLRGGYAAIVCCLGNSEHHAGALSALRRLRGVVLAHDARMNDLYALSIDEPGAVPEGFAQSLASMYGDRIPQRYAHVGRLSGDDAERLGVLMAREVVDLAERVAVMSEFAAEMIRLDADPGLGDRVVVVPFGMRTPVTDATPTGARAPLVASFGIQNEVKHTALLIEAMSVLVREYPGASLALVGRCSDDYRDHLLDLARTLGIADRVVITGAIDPTEYAGWLDRAAVAVQLRRTSNGECSGAVSDCMAAGAALLVSDIGASRELPDAAAARIDPAASAAELARAIAGLLGDPARRAGMVDAARAYARSRSFAVAAERLYRDALAPGIANASVPAGRAQPVG
jgi:glycosyltransferase involved in cell wall biosynthesis